MVPCTWQTGAPTSCSTKIIGHPLALYLLLAITITVCTGAPPLAADGVVLATEKKMPSILVDEQSLHKVVKLNDKIGMVYSVRLTS